MPKTTPRRSGVGNRVARAAAPLEPADRGDSRLLRALAAARADEAYGAAQACDNCRALRFETDDADALCERHLAQALGVLGGWDLGPGGRRV
ncbi:MAG: hypothetical protein FJ100_09990 [Deltaproteobacteria bacterium]|nr:hypothetical protein [Deltaproteobacteria bacterium]